LSHAIHDIAASSHNPNAMSAVVVGNIAVVSKDAPRVDVDRYFARRRDATAFRFAPTAALADFFLRVDELSVDSTASAIAESSGPLIDIRPTLLPAT
jgi:hypothetical protein